MNDSTSQSRPDLSTATGDMTDGGHYFQPQKPKIDGYEIIELLGVGGMGAVWKALQLGMQRQVAIKVLPGGQHVSLKARLRFEREIELAARLTHESIARVYTSGLHHEQYYYIMELVSGVHLDQYVTNRKLTIKEIVRLMIRIGNGVQYAHQQGVIHRDLKASNILVEENGCPHILDFGLAKTYQEEDKGLTVSLDGDTLGTPAYMSPEQAAGKMDRVDVRTDIYSLGIIMYNLLTQKWPHDLGGTRYEIFRIKQEFEPKRPTLWRQDIDRDLEAVMIRAIARKPEERYQSVTEFISDLQSWLDGMPVKAVAVNSWYILKKLIQKNRFASSVVALLAIIICSTTFISSYFWIQAGQERNTAEQQAQEYQEEAKNNLALYHQVAFNSYLSLLQANKMQEAKIFALSLQENSMEKAAVTFLGGQEDYPVRLQKFNAALKEQHPVFKHYIVGESHRMRNETDLAVASYQEAIRSSAQTGDPGNLYAKMAKSRITQLTGQEFESETGDCVYDGNH